MIASNMLKWIDTPSKRKWIPNKFVHHVSSTMQLIDILFEGLPNLVFHQILDKLGMQDIFALARGGVLEDLTNYVQI